LETLENDRLAWAVLARFIADLKKIARVLQ
jgi:hypothetical protein